MTLSSQVKVLEAVRMDGPPRVPTTLDTAAAVRRGVLGGEHEHRVAAQQCHVLALALAVSDCGSEKSKV